MKKHSFLSYVFWATTAVLTGITVSSAIRTAKTAHRYIAGAGTIFYLRSRTASRISY